MSRLIHSLCAPWQVREFASRERRSRCTGCSKLFWLVGAVPRRAVAGGADCRLSVHCSLRLCLAERVTHSAAPRKLSACCNGQVRSRSAVITVRPTLQTLGRRRKHSACRGMRAIAGGIALHLSWSAWSLPNIRPWIRLGIYLPLVALLLLQDVHTFPASSTLH